jgi:general stress protein 26
MRAEIRDAFWHALARSPAVMLRLAGPGEGVGQPLAHPMTAQLDSDADGCIRFFMSRDNALAAGGPAQADFSATGHDVFAMLEGELVEEADPAVFDRLFTDEVAAWFEGGKASAEALLMRLDIANAEVWTTDQWVSGLFRRLTGKTPQKGDHDSGPIS